MGTAANGIRSSDLFSFNAGPKRKVLACLILEFFFPFLRNMKGDRNAIGRLITYIQDLQGSKMFCHGYFFKPSIRYFTILSSTTSCGMVFLERCQDSIPLMAESMVSTAT